MRALALVAFLLCPLAAFAQAAGGGGGGSDACTGKACTVASLTSTGTISGPTASYSGTLTSTVGTGQNAVSLPSNTRISSAGTEGYIGPTSSTNTWTCSGNWTVAGNLVMSGGANQLLDLASGTITNSAANTPAAVSDADGFRLQPVTLGTCGSNSVLEGTFQVISQTGAVKTKVCVCAKDGSGTFQWRNLLNPSDTTGTTTACPASL